MIQSETVPAIGCTEPIAVAYAAAVAKKYMNSKVEKIQVLASKNIYKNGKSVMIPGAGEWGLDLAAVLGMVIGDPEAGLMVLKNIDGDSVKLAHDWLEEKEISVDYLEDGPNIYVEVHLISDGGRVRAVVKDSHDNIDSIWLDGENIYKSQGREESAGEDYYEALKEMTFKEIREIVSSYSIAELDFIGEGVATNKRAAEIGLKRDSGLNIGRTLYKIQQRGQLGNDEATNARIRTAAASDMRMGGGLCPIMTSGGSGNQGLGVILPIATLAESRGIDDEKLYKAIFFGHVINKYIKLYTGKLSAMCGCAIAAGVGAAAGMTWMLGGDDRQIAGACENLLANLAGMICDGAKDNCSIKLSTSAYEAVISSMLAMEGVMASKNIGIVGSTVEETIKNVGILAKEGFQEIDDLIIDIIN